MFGLFASRCQICGNVFRRNRYLWTIRGKKAWVCPTCNSKLERQKSKQAFDPDAEVFLPEVNDEERSGYGGCGGCLVIILGACVAASLLRPSTVPKVSYEVRNDPVEPTPASDIKKPGSKPARPEVITEPRFATVEDAQREAVKRFPDLGIGGSKLNNEFVARHKRYKQQRPDYFRDTSWPIRLAEEIMGSTPANQAK